MPCKVCTASPTVLNFKNYLPMSSEINYEKLGEKALSAPLVTHLYTADPSAHVFDGRLYIYPSHDIDAGIPFNDNGDHFGMRDYHVFSMDEPSGPVTDHGVALDIADVPWASRQMWAPDAARKGDKYSQIPNQSKAPTPSTPPYSKTTTAATTSTLGASGEANCRSTATTFTTKPTKNPKTTNRP